MDWCFEMRLMIYLVFSGSLQFYLEEVEYLFRGKQSFRGNGCCY